ncbi:MAG: hypothetical protein V1647_07060 [Pseudomonadota bacterium]
MRRHRELKEFLSTPVFYIVAGIFLALSGYKFYSLLMSYIDFMNVYPDYLAGTEVKELAGVSINSYLFPRLFSFYSYLVLISVPILNSGIGQDRTMELDKLELTASGITELKLILRKVFTSSLVIVVILLPTIIYPLIISVFTTVDYGTVFSSYLGLLLLILLSSCIVSPVSVLKIPFAVSIFFNVIMLLILYMYILEPVFSPFMFGVIRLCTLLFIVTFAAAFILISKRIYLSTRLFA